MDEAAPAEPTPPPAQPSKSWYRRWTLWLVWDGEGELLTEGKIGTQYNATVTAYDGQLIVAAGATNSGHD